MRHVSNERGGMLLYVMCVFMIVIIAVPVILNSVSSVNVQHRKQVTQQRVQQLVKSGLQILYHHDDLIEYMRHHTYSASPLQINAPGSVPIDYYQYAAAKDETRPDHPDRAVNVHADLTGKKIVVMAIAGDLNGNARQDEGERDFYKQWLVFDPHPQEALEENDAHDSSELGIDHDL